MVAAPLCRAGPREARLIAGGGRAGDFALKVILTTDAKFNVLLM
jgi:hypothetical protein